MRLSELEPLASFALLGPGFSGGGWRLLRGLRRDASPELVVAAYESAGREAAGYRAETIDVVEVEFDTPMRALEVRLDESGHADGVRTIREAIAAGDVYQVNLTLRARIAPTLGSELFATVCARGVPRYAAWVRLPDGSELVSASPELLFEITGDRIRSEPMKGTARRGAGEALEASDKDRAELAMITDLIRNDLTPVCLPRTVRVACERRVVPLAYALQTVSDVEGVLRPGGGPLEALEALHPGGSVTGAPKRAAMEMIARLEREPRGPYCGSLGLCSDGAAVFSLMIRTAWRAGAGGEWIYGVGGGIVYDSDPARELEEVHVKLGALGCATRR